MGISSLSISLLLAAAPPSLQPVAPNAAVRAPSQPMAEADYRVLLTGGDVTQLDAACRDAARFGLHQRLRDGRDRLLQVAPVSESFALVTATSRALLACRAPESARRVLGRISPEPGPQRQEWLLLSWQAAAAALDHGAAVLALRRFADGDLTRLEARQIEVGETTAGVVLTRSALDQLAFHEAALGHFERAAAVVLSGQMSGLEAAERLARAARWLESLEQPDVTRLLESALDQAAAVEAWALAEELLRLQWRLERNAGGDGARPMARLQRLATRVDDRYTLWQLLQEDPASGDGVGQRAALERQLRSPREQGGHVSLGESSKQGPAGPVPSANP
ncbi:MAG: hypothetical protein ACON4T_06520 [Synechococcus sp.]